MSETWYQISSGRWTPEIVSVQVVSHTSNRVKLWGGRWANKVSTYHSYYPSFDEAKSALVSLHEEQVVSCRRQLELANRYLGNVKGMLVENCKVRK